MYLRSKSEGFISSIFFLYVNKLIRKGTKKTLEYEDLYKLDDDLLYSEVYPKFEKNYQDFKSKHKKVSLGSILYSAFKSLFFTSAILSILATGFDVGIPVLIKYMVEWLEEKDSLIYKGLVLAALISLCSFLKATLTRRSIYYTFITQYKSGMVMRSIIYSKINLLSRESISNMNLGNLTNILNHDTFKLQLMVRLAILGYSIPIISIMGFVYFFIYFNWLAILFPLFVLVWVIVIVIGNYYLYKYQSQMMVVTDKRGKLITECLTGIKNIKFECWESISMKRLQNYRKKESSYLFKYVFIRIMLNAFVDILTPFFILTFLSIYTSFYDDITISNAYLLISLSNLCNYPLRAFVALIDSYSSVQLALKRINSLLNVPERVPLLDDLTIPRGSIVLENLSTGWKSKEIVEYFETNEDYTSVCLHNLKMNFQSGKMYAIVGKVGSGKTAFLTTLLNEMDVKNGSLKMNGSVAYVSQNPFLLNATVKDNIIFGEKFDDARYKMCVVKCRLVDDIKNLPGGDQTEIGERGVNLSGGQKQRISLARGLYCNKDIYLIDDTLSALDSQVAKSVFADVLVGELRRNRKTVILATHALAILDQCDSVLLIENGRIVIEGPFSKIKNDVRYQEYAVNEEKARKMSGDYGSLLCSLVLN